jgi:hypothetical protein
VTHYVLGGNSVRYQSVAPMVVVRTLTSEVYVKGEGRLLPADADPNHIEQLLARGLIKKRERNS